MRLFPKDRDLSVAPERVELRVRASDLQLPVEEVHVRLDAFLGRFLHWRSRTSIQALIREGFVEVDASDPSHPRGTGALGVELRPGRKLLHGSLVVVTIPEPLRIRSSIAATDELVVLHEDDWVLAVDKPPQLPVHPSGRHLADTLVQRVHARYGQERERREFRAKLCHRLDRETSGVCLLARDPKSHAELMRQFEAREVEKEYLAVVRGCPERDEGVVDLALGPDRHSEVRLKMACRPDGVPARTAWRVVERYGRPGDPAGRALVVCRLYTGRQHQIRVHLDAIGHSLVGDKLYGVDEQIFLRAASGEATREDAALVELPRHALHSARLVVTHPRTAQRLELKSGLPADLREYLTRCAAR